MYPQKETSHVKCKVQQFFICLIAILNLFCTFCVLEYFICLFFHEKVTTCIMPRAISTLKTW